MIQANEIKPNNIIDTPYGIATVYGISKDCVQITLKDNESIFDFDLEDAKPIELTEDILLKCGFRKVKGTYRDCTKLIQKGLGGGNPNWDLYVDFGDDNDTKKISISLVNDESEWFTSKAKYLHQLQNLYFALTQTELEINL